MRFGVGEESSLYASRGLLRVTQVELSYGARGMAVRGRGQGICVAADPLLLALGGYSRVIG